MIKEFIKSRTISFYLRAAALVLAIVPLFYMGARSTIETEYVTALVFGVLAVAAHAVTFVFENKSWSDYIELAASIFVAAEFSVFLTGGVLSVVDYIYGINFWGDATQVPAIIGYGVVLFISAALSIACCFMSKAYEKKAGK